MSKKVSCNVIAQNAMAFDGTTPALNWDEVYRRFAPMVQRRAMQILRHEDDALDATHDIFLSLRDKWESFRGQSQIGTWLYRVTTNHCLNRLRSKRIAERAADRIGQTADSVEADAATSTEFRRTILRLIDKFGERKVQMMIHRYYDEMSHEEIAEVMGISDRAVRKALKTFVEKARQELSTLAVQIGAIPVSEGA